MNVTLHGLGRALMLESLGAGLDLMFFLRLDLIMVPLLVDPCLVCHDVEVLLVNSWLRVSKLS
jgi:hypothetical protein